MNRSDERDHKILGRKTRFILYRRTVGKDLPLTPRGATMRRELNVYRRQKFVADISVCILRYRKARTTSNRTLSYYKDSMCIMRSMMKFVLRPMTYPPFSALSSGRSYRDSCAYCGNRASIAMSNQNYESQGPDILSCGYVISALQKKKRCGDR